MTYAQNNLIEASDFNTLVGNDTSPSTTVAYNTLLGVGNGKYGYGQTTITNVSANTSVQASNWSSLTTKMTSLANHQLTAITSVVTPTQNQKITYLAPLTTNLNSLYANKNNARLQGTSVATATVNSGSWSNRIVFEHVITFESADKARYFFNTGGQIALTFSSPNSGGAINTLFSNLATDCGTVVISAPTNETITIAGTNYQGVTKIGGSGTATVASTRGYYGLTSSLLSIFKQQPAAGAASGYLGSFIEVQARTNGTQGSNADNGSVITIQTIWDEIPNGLIVAPNTTTTCTVRYPSNGYITNTWGTVSVAGTVSGS